MVTLPGGGLPVPSGTRVHLLNPNLSIHGDAPVNPATGAYSFGAVPPGAYVLRAIPPQVSDYTPSNFQPINVLYDPLTVDLQLTNPSITGTVYAPDGLTPVDAWVSVFAAGRQVESRLAVSGSLKVGGLFPGTYELQARRATSDPYWRSARISVTVTGGVTVQNLTLTPANVYGNVTDSTGNPVPGSTVHVARHPHRVERDVTDGNGYYAIGGLETGTYWLAVTPPWDEPGLISPLPITFTVPPAQQQIDLQFLSPRKIVSGVVKTNTEDPVYHALVAARRVDQNGEARALTSVAGVKFTDTEPLYGDAYGQVAVSLRPRKEEGSRDVQAIIDSLRKEIESLPGPGRLSFLMLSGGGPPLTKPVRVRVRNDDPAQLRAATDELVRIVRAIPGTKDVTDDDVPGRPQFVLTLDRDAIRATGLDPGLVARLVRLHVDGEIVTQMREEGEKLEVRVRAKARDSADVGRLLADPIALPGGGTTTFGALVRAETRTGKGVIKHHNLRRSITVEADLERKRIDTVAANQAIRAAWERIRARYPDTTLDFSGELDDITESLEAMKVLFLLGVGLIYVILAAQFRSYWQPAMILATVPLAFTGVVFGLLISGNPLSLFTLYGVVALTGIAVNSAIVLIDAANVRRRQGIIVLHAIVFAARRRVVPIIITSTTTIAGLFSLAFGLGGHSLIWGPVAASIVWGIGFSTLLSLFAMPMLYWGLMPERRRRPAAGA